MNRFGILKNTVFRNFFFASLIGLFGEGIFSLTNIVLVQRETGSVLAISFLIMMTMLPSVFLAPFGGVIIDRWNKAKVAFWCNLIRFVCLLALALLFYVDLFSIQVLYAAIFVCYLVFHLLTPTTESMLKEALSEEEYMQGVSLTQAAWQVGLLSSGLLAGILIQFTGPVVTLLVASATYLIGALLYLGIVSIYRPAASPVSSSEQPFKKLGLRFFLHDIKQGFGYLLKNKGVLYLSLGACISFPFFSGINILIGPFNYEVLRGDEFTLGLVSSGAGIGSLLSAGVCLWLSKKKGIPGYLIASLILLGLSVLLFSWTTQYWLAFLLYIVLGLFIGNVKVLSKTLVYQHVETAYIGRTMTTINMISLGSATLFSLLIGYIGERDLTSAYLAILALLVLPILFTLAGRAHLNAASKRRPATVPTADTPA